MPPAATSSPPHRHPGVGHRERGSTSVQLVLLLPALFSVMFLGMQGALYYHARTVAIAAAREGARTAAGLDGTGPAGAQDAYTFVADAGDVLKTPHVSSVRSATTATVTITGRSLSVIPGWSPVVTQSASVPVERIT